MTLTEPIELRCPKLDTSLSLPSISNIPSRGAAATDPRRTSRHIRRAAASNSIPSVSFPALTKPHLEPFGLFDPADLAALHYPRKELIEYWAHAALAVAGGVLSRISELAMVQFADPAHRVGQWAHDNAALSTMYFARSSGKVRSRPARSTARGDQTQPLGLGREPAKQALDYLWTLGELVVLRRVGFERVYELTDRAFPEIRTGPLPTQDEESSFFHPASAHRGRHWHTTVDRRLLSVRLRSIRAGVEL